MVDPGFSKIESMAADEYLARRKGASQPAAVYQGTGWAVMQSEIRSCCLPISSGMLFHHCKGLQHVCQLYGVDKDRVERLLTKRFMNGGANVRRANA